MTSNNNDRTAPIGFESELWRAADALRSNMDAAKYKNVVLGLIFLKHIIDAFEEYHARLATKVLQGANCPISTLIQPRTAMNKSTALLTDRSAAMVESSHCVPGLPIWRHGCTKARLPRIAEDVP